MIPASSLKADGTTGRMDGNSAATATAIFTKTTAQRHSATKRAARFIGRILHPASVG